MHSAAQSHRHSGNAERREGGTEAKSAQTIRQESHRPHLQPGIKSTSRSNK